MSKGRYDRIWAWQVPSGFRAWSLDPRKRGPSTEYVRADVADRLKRERDAYREACLAARLALGQAAQGVWVDGEIHNVRGAREGFYALRDAIDAIEPPE